MTQRAKTATRKREKRPRWTQIEWDAWMRYAELQDNNRPLTTNEVRAHQHGFTAGLRAMRRHLKASSK